MRIIIDGIIQEPEPNLLDNINPADVESVELLDDLHNTAVYGSQGAAGVIVVTLKRGHKINNYYKYAPGVVTYAPKGFYVARTFYAPQYDTPHINEKMADLRSTIYWGPAGGAGRGGGAAGGGGGAGGGGAGGGGGGGGGREGKREEGIGREGGKEEGKRREVFFFVFF